MSLTLRESKSDTVGGRTREKEGAADCCPLSASAAATNAAAAAASASAARPKSTGEPTGAGAMTSRIAKETLVESTGIEGVLFSGLFIALHGVHSASAIVDFQAERQGQPVVVRGDGAKGGLHQLRQQLRLP